MKQLSVMLLVIGAMAAIGGCASSRYDGPAASPATTAAAECERNHGVWRTALNFCEYQAPEAPRPPR
jgi:hypothetical protein